MNTQTQPVSSAATSWTRLQDYRARNKTEASNSGPIKSFTDVTDNIIAVNQRSDEAMEFDALVSSSGGKR
jgi:hypothetical protein